MMNPPQQYFACNFTYDGTENFYIIYIIAINDLQMSETWERHSCLHTNRKEFACVYVIVCIWNYFKWQFIGVNTQPSNIEWILLVSQWVNRVSHQFFSLKLVKCPCSIRQREYPCQCQGFSFLSGFFFFIGKNKCFFLLHFFSRSRLFLFHIRLNTWNAFFSPGFLALSDMRYIEWKQIYNIFRV